MGSGKECFCTCKFFGEVAPMAPEKRAENFSIIFVMNTTHQLGNFRFTDFYKTWHEYANHSARESFCSEILKFFR